MSRRRVIASGAGLIVLYLGVLSVTVIVRDTHIRPLYDGFTTPTPYSWVDPPAFFASGNQKPGATSTIVKLGPEGSDAMGMASPDGQFAIDLARDAIAPHGSDRQVKVEITPFDPKQLAQVPHGLRANGNAYCVKMTYEPSGATVAVAAIVKPGTLLIQVPEVGNNLFHSVNGRGWSTLPARAMGRATQLSFSAAFGGPGYYVGATTLPELAGPTGGSSHRTIAFGIGVGVLALLLILAGAFVARRVRRRPSAAG